MDLLLPLIILLPLGLLIFQQRKRQRLFAEQQARLAVGQTVMTTAGMYGQVVEVGDTEMVLEVAPGVRLRWNKAAVGQIVEPATPEQADDLATPSTVDLTATEGHAGQDRSVDGRSVDGRPVEDRLEGTDGNAPRTGSGPDLSKS